MRIFLLFVIIVIVLPWLQIKKNREKVAAYIQTHPELMRFFRPPGVYIVIMSIILLYAFG